MVARSRKIPGAHGLSLHALESGDSGETCVLLHGFGHEAHVWDELAETLCRDLRVVALDLRGHGQSDWDPQGRYDRAALVADLEMATAYLGLSEFTLVGHSLGGEAALCFAAAHPERLTRLVLVDIGPEVGVVGAMRIGSDERQAERAYASVEAYARALAARHPLGDPSALARLASHSLRRHEDGRLVLTRDPAFTPGSSSSFREEVRGGERFSDASLWAALAEIRCPALVVRGVASSLLPRDVAARMADEVLAKGSLVTVPMAGHGVMLDNPQGCLESIAPFVRSLAPGTSRS